MTFSLSKKISFFSVEENIVNVLIGRIVFLEAATGYRCCKSPFKVSYICAGTLNERSKPSGHTVLYVKSISTLTPYMTHT